MLPTSTDVFLGMTAVIASEPMCRLMHLVERVARAATTVLITGESGSGKELVARALHHFSARHHRPWVDVSCAALPEHLLESELFGYEKGAFSGADRPKPGLFELAHQGTLFLDEIGELEPKMQVKLLRVLDGVPYYRLGGVKKISVDVRVVAATNQNLEAAISEGRFRSDLYHRLTEFVLQVPPLRERIADIAPLAHHFLAACGPHLELTAAAMRALEAHAWPGNIRELRNVVLKAAVMAVGSRIDAGDLQISAPEYSRPVTRGEDPGLRLDGMERRMILDALSTCGGHQQQAAARLGISRRTLSRKLKIYESQGVAATV